MPSASETKMNLSALQQVDPEINEIVDWATQVALFQYSTQTSQWTKTDIEGALFVYAHRNPSERGLIILNRHSPKNYKEPITADIEFKMNQKFLIYKTPSGQIFGAWFYVAEECTRVGNRCCRLVSYLKKRAKNTDGGGGGQSSAEKGVSILQGLLLPPNPGGSHFNEKSNGSTKNHNNNNMNGNSNHNNNSSGGGGSSSSNKQNGHQAPQGKDIMSLLQRAQIDDKPPPKKPLGQDNSANRKQESTNGTGNQRRSNGGAGGSHYEASPGVPVVHKPVPTKALPPSVEQLFKSAGRKQQHQQQQQAQQQSAAAAATAKSGSQHQTSQQNQLSSNSNGGTTSGAQLIQSLAQQIPKTPQRVENPLDRLLSLAGGSPTSSTSHLGVVAPAAPPINDCMASILSKLNESAQKVHREQQQLQQVAVGSSSALDAGRTSPQETATAAGGGNIANALFGALGGGVASVGPAVNSSGGGNAVEKKLTLITPEMLEESLSQTGPLTPPSQTSAIAAGGTMSRLELRNTLVHLLEHDDEFLAKIHLAYVQAANRRKLVTTFPYDHA